jgi:glucose/arabinose dehydrogenase
MHRPVTSIVAVILLVSAATAVAQRGQPAPPAAALPAELGTQTGQRIKVTQVASGLVHPWSLAFADAKTMLVTEQPSRLRVVRDGHLLPDPAWVAPSPAAAPGAKPSTD